MHDAHPHVPQAPVDFLIPFLSHGGIHGSAPMNIDTQSGPNRIDIDSMQSSAMSIGKTDREFWVQGFDEANQLLLMLSYDIGDYIHWGKICQVRVMNLLHGVVESYGGHKICSFAIGVSCVFCNLNFLQE